jgi:hypothetical protein
MNVAANVLASGVLDGFMRGKESIRAKVEAASSDAFLPCGGS